MGETHELYKKYLVINYDGKLSWFSVTLFLPNGSQ